MYNNFSNEKKYSKPHGSLYQQKLETVILSIFITPLQANLITISVFIYLRFFSPLIHQFNQFYQNFPVFDGEKNRAMRYDTNKYIKNHLHSPKLNVMRNYTQSFDYVLVCALCREPSYNRWLSTYLLFSNITHRLCTICLSSTKIVLNKQKVL